jgi:hypothetical protein
MKGFRRLTTPSVAFTGGRLAEAGVAKTSLEQ